MESEIAEGFLSKIGEYLAEAAINQGRYLCCFNNIVEDLKEEERKLISAERHMKKEVEKARNNTIVIDDDVKEWLSDASEILAEVQILNQEIEVKKSCLNGWCPNWGCRYWLGRKATKKTINIKRVVEKGEFKNLGEPAPLPDDIEFLPPEDFEFFKSSKFAFEQIIEALTNNQINLVGLYGMGGTGKTTLAKAVGKKVEEGKMFDKVITAVISQTPNFEDIQAQLAKSLGLELKEKTEKDRAKRLYTRFMGTDTQNDTETNKKQETEKKILLILDDVWKKFDLTSKIGISFDSGNMGCKVLLTTRLEQVCIDMDCQQRTQLNVLEEKEGLALLKRHARIVDDSSELNDVATQVARECGGLPLAFVAIGCALKEKGIDDWEVMLQKLRKSKLEDIPDNSVAGEEGIYASLKVSYDYLMGKNKKSCFLLCALFPEDHAIHLEELFWYAMGLGLYLDADLIKNARSELLTTARYLKASGLLLDAGEEYVKMHDMVRDVALWIASKGENVFMSKVGMGQIEWSKEKHWGRYTAISSINNIIEELSIGLVCPKLEILILGGESESKKLKVSDECFEEMKGLKVLSLTYVDFSLKSLQFLMNLKTLKLSYCNTRDISYLKKLNRLEILLFDDPSFDELPRELSELCELRLFYLNKSVRIPSNVLRRCSKLEELYTLDRFRYGADEETSMASIFEVISLSRLSTLHFSIYATCLSKDLAFPKLQRYVICVNTGRYNILRKRALGISNVEAVSLKAFKALYETLEYLRLENVRGCQNILPSIDQGGFNELKEADISACDMLQEVFQLEGLCHAGKQVLRRLAKLRLEKLPLLRHIWKGPIPHLNLQSLTHLRVHSCDILEHIFPISIARDLVRLEELTIRNAPQLKQVFYMDHGREEITAENDGKDIELPMLRILTLAMLPLLRHIWKGPIHHLNLQSLTYLWVDSCNILEHIFPFSIARDLVRLEELTIRNAPQLKQVFYMDHAREEIIAENDGKDMELPKLRILRLERLESLTSFLPENYHSKWPMLEELHISECSSLTTTSFISMLSEELSIEKCAEKENIIEDNEEDHSQPLLFPSLRKINVNGCGKLKYLFPISITQHLQQLESIKVESCDQLEKIFEEKDGVEVMNDKEIILPQLKELSLIELPSLTNFGPMGYHFILKLERSLHISGRHQICCQGPVIVICGLQPELRSLEEVENLLGPQNLFALCIIKCLRLKHIFSSNLARDLLQLKELYIINCEELEQIIVEDEKNHIQTPFFPNLSRIDVSGCNKLEHLFPVNIAAGLKQLKSIDVQGCDQLQKVFGPKNGVDDTNDEEIVLPQLERLSFKELPNLTNFGPVGYRFSMQLKFLIMKGCNDELWKSHFGDWEDFSVDSFKVTKVYYNQEHVTITFQKDGGCKFTISGVDKSELSCVTDPLCLGLFRGLTLTFTLLNLSHLEIHECHKMIHIFSSNLAQDLLQLSYLHINNCEELEQIIVEDGEDDHIQTLFFPNLRRIDIRGCNKLKNVFPITMVRGLQKLYWISVEECDQLEEVFIDGDNVMDDKEVMFSPRGVLQLQKLPRLTNFCSPGYHCIFPSLAELRVNCPNIATRFSRGEGRSVHAECKPPNEGINDGDQPTMDLDCRNRSDLEENLPPYMEKMMSKGSPSSRKQNGEEPRRNSFDS